MVEPEQKRRSAHPTEALSSDDGARRLVEEIKAGWSKGEPADAVRALDQHQQLRERKSFVLDLAYEEYCRRTDEGEMVERKAFIERFPTHARSLARLLDVHDYLSQAGTLTGLSPAKWPQIGDRFLGFEVVEELGRGAFARVYRATELALGNRPVVLKVARQGAGEADTLGRLRHRNVVPVHAVLEDPDSGLTAIVMPYLGSRTLCEFLDEAAAKPSQRYVENVLSIGSKLCDALEFTHSNGVLHRDLKPSNILLSADEEPMLLDFNLAVRLDQETARAGGTLPYMAPEQLESIHRKSTTVVDSRADIFGLGVVLYEMLTGELPFHPKEPSSAAAQWECRRSPRETVRRRLLQTTDPGVTEVVGRCLEFDANARPHSAQELGAQLKALLKPRHKVARWIWGHQLLATVAFSLVLFLTFATIGWAMLRPPAHVRAYHLGIELMRAGDFENAANSFSESLSTTRDARVLVARGRAYAQMGDREPSYFAVASRDFRQADELSPRASTIALSGFSLGKLNSHEGAILYYKKSQLGGFQSPGLWNDLGYSYLQTSRLPEAREAFNQAIALDPTFQPAYVNRAKLGLREAVRESRFPEDALKDVKVALSLGSHPEILRDYALILAVASRTDEQYWKQTAEALNEATSAGIDTHTLLEQSMSAPLKSRPEFALYRTPEKPPAPWNPYPVVVDPLGSPANITTED